MNSILDCVNGKLGTLPSVVFCDSGFSELLKWRGGADAPSDVLVLALCSANETAINSWMKRAKPLRGIFLVNTPLRDSVWVVKQQCELFNFSECIVLTTSTNESTVLPGEEVALDEPYAFAKRLLRPTKASVVYFPLHTLPMLVSLNSEVELLP